MSKGLEALYKLEMSAVCDDNMSVDKAEELRHIIGKELKALEIIKRNPFAFACLTIGLKDFDTYEEWERINPNYFTKEEYDLLKELFYNE